MEHLLSKGHSVRSLDILPPESPQLQGRVEALVGDVRDRAAVRHAVRDCELVVHNAAAVPVTRSSKEFQEVNTQGTMNVLEASLDSGVRKLVFVSSSAVYGIPCVTPITEATPISPFGDYGKSKAAAEKVCREFRERGLDISIIRPRTIVGPGRMGILDILFDRVRRGRSFFILGDGRNRFQLLGLDDILSALYLVATKSCRNEDFNVGAQEFGTLRDDLEALAAHAGTGSRIVSLPETPARLLLKLQDVFHLGPLVDYHYHVVARDLWFSMDKLQRLLGWRAVQSNVEMLCETYDWYIEKGHSPDSRARSPHSRGVKGRLLGAVLRVIR